MSSLHRLVITYSGTTDDFKSVVDLKVGGRDAANNFMSFIGSLIGGNQMGNLAFAIGAAQAAGTFTVGAGGSTNGQVGTLLNTNLTAVTSGADPALGQFNISATAATQAASMVTAINTVLATKVIATRVNGIVTVTTLVPGVVGNGLQISAGNLSNVTAGAFANGSSGTAYNINLL